MKKWLIKLGCFVAVCILSVVLLNRLLMPKYMTGITEGAFIAEYYKEETDHDVLFIGDCEAYENISPVTLYREFGFTSFIRGSAQQLIWQSYYLLEDALRYETPKVVVFNVLSLKYNEPQKEEYNRMTLDGMKMSSSKINAIRASMTADESMPDYLLPLLRYHSRWSELSSDDFKYYFTRDLRTHSGYYMRVDVKPVISYPEKRPLEDYNFGENAMNYLEKIRLLCEQNGITLVLMKAPSISPVWYDEWEAQVVKYAEEHSLLYINTLALADEIGIDYSTDTYDKGLHLNVYGAEKLSKYLGAILSERFGLPDRRNTEPYCTVWEKKGQFYDSEKARMEAELKNE